MFARTRMRELRGTRTLKALGEVAGIPEGTMSQLERGIMLPRDEWLPGLVRAYGVESIGDLYDFRGPLLVVEMDAREAA